MLEALSEKQIIRLHRELIAPVAVHEIIHGRDELDETARYTLDAMIAELQPDTALLCIALCIVHVADMHSTYMPVAGTLGFEASRIVHEYGPLWLSHVDGRLQPKDESRVLNLLDNMQEDFEALADLIETMQAGLIETTDSAILCSILSENARAFYDYLEQEEKESMIMQMEQERIESLRLLDSVGNVIPFPRVNLRYH